MNIRFYRYPWRVGFEDLSEEDVSGLRVASGACCVVPTGLQFHSPFPGKRLCLNGDSYSLYELPDTDSTGRISSYSHDDYKLHAALGAYEGLFIDKDGVSSDLTELARESLKYVQRLEDIIDEQCKGTADAIKRVDWDLALLELRQTDWLGDLVRKPLIVDLAENQQFPLKEIARGAKRVLRRKRGVERLSKAREFDKASLIRIAQLPGRTIAEKAGPKQRIPAVKRYETTDTLENRVVEHFCRLAEGEWLRNQSDDRTSLSNEWLRLASGFVGLCKRVKRNDDFCSIQKLKSPCISPNYTLEQNTNYRAVWQGYRKLIKRQSEREECWAWARRLFLNRAYVYLAELFRLVFSDSETIHFPYHKHLRARLAHQYGLWLDAESMPGPRVIQSDQGETLTAYLFSPQDIQAGFGLNCELLRLNADAYIALLGKTGMSVCPMFGFVGSSEEESCREAERDLEQVFDRIKNNSAFKEAKIHITKPLFIWADFLGSRGLRGDSDGVLQTGIPVINDSWISPSESIVLQLRKELLG